MRTIYKIATEANGMSRKSSAGKSLGHNEKQFDYKSMNEEDEPWMQETLLG